MYMCYTIITSVYKFKLKTWVWKRGILLCWLLYWCDRDTYCLCWGLNSGPLVYKSSTLPIELKRELTPPPPSSQPEIVGMLYLALAHWHLISCFRREVPFEEGKRLADSWKVAFLETCAKEHHVRYSFTHSVQVLFL